MDRMLFNSLAALPFQESHEDEGCCRRFSLYSLVRRALPSFIHVLCCHPSSGKSLFFNISLSQVIPLVPSFSIITTLLLLSSEERSEVCVSPISFVREEMERHSLTQLTYSILSFIPSFFLRFVGSLPSIH